MKYLKLFENFGISNDITLELLDNLCKYIINYETIIDFSKIPDSLFKESKRILNGVNLYKGTGQKDKNYEYGEYDFSKFIPKPVKLGAKYNKISWTYSKDFAMWYACDAYGEFSIPIIVKTNPNQHEKILLLDVVFNNLNKEHFSYLMKNNQNGNSGELLKWLEGTYGGIIKPLSFEERNKQNKWGIQLFEKEVLIFDNFTVGIEDIELQTEEIRDIEHTPNELKASNTNI